MEEQEAKKDHRCWWLKMLLASAALAAFMLSLAGASWVLAVRRCERDGSQFTEWESYVPADESEWDITLSSGLQGLAQEELLTTDWDGYGLIDMDRAGPAPAAVPAGELRRLLWSIWQKVTGNG